MRDVNGTYTVMDDLCPHCAAPLSEGRVFKRTAPDGKQQTVIKCGYHGCRFGCDGGRLDIPEKSREPSKLTRVRGVYETAVAPFRLIFVWPGDPDRATALPIPKDLLPSDSKRPVLYFREVHRSLPLPFRTVMENIADPAHVPWSHHKVDSDRHYMRAGKQSLQITKRDLAQASFCGTFSDGSRELYMHMRGIRLQYSAYKDKDGKPRYIFPIWLVPVSRNITRLFSIRMLFEPPPSRRLLSIIVPRWRQHLKGNLVLDGDCPLLHSQNRHLAHTAVRSGSPGWHSQYLLSETNCDTMVIEFLRWFDSVGNQLPFVSSPSTQIPNPISRFEINDRFRWHVQNCVTCSTVLRNFRILYKVSRMIAIMTILGSFTTALCGAAVAAGQPAASQSLFQYAKTLLVTGILMVATALMANRAVLSFTYTTKARRLVTTPDTTF